jgi:prepilin signal peptidase PulO-like enzyme (type II secretory pathway)
MATRRIPNALTYPAFLVGLVLLVLLAPEAIGRACFGVAVAAGPLLAAALVAPSGLGMGDVKLMAVVGLLLGAPSAMVAVVAGIVLAGLFSVVGLLTRRLSRRQSVPLGPFLAIGAVYALANTGSVLLTH